MIDLNTKLRDVAQIIDGRIVTDQPGLAICVKGSVFGFPAILQAIQPGWPFGCTYILETEVIEDPNRIGKNDVLKLIAYPRMGQGIMSFLSHILLFESKGMPVRDKHMESRFVFSYDNQDMAERFIKYPGVTDRLINLEDYSKFSEMTVKTDAGLMLSQPKSFRALDLDVCRETFRILGELGQIIFEAF